MGKRRAWRLRGQRKLAMPAPPQPPSVQRSALQIHQQVSATSWSGPLPAPADLEHYNRVFPGCAERIMAMAESQSAHRQSLEKATVLGNLRQATRGQYIGAFLAAFATLGGVYLLATGKEIQGY